MTKDTIWAFFWDAPQQAADIGSRMFPPRWSYIEPALAAVIGHAQYCDARDAAGDHHRRADRLPGGAQHDAERRVVRPIALFIIVSSRSINSLIWALLLVIILGPGVLAGIVAIALRSIGFIGKLLYEAIEEIDLCQVEAIQATGAAPAQVIDYGIVPQIQPTFAGVSVFRWDINIRESTVVGLVGAGGIGLNLEASLNTLAWAQVSLILLVIFGTVLLSEWVSAKVRHAII